MTLTISKCKLSKQQHTITLDHTLGENEKNSLIFTLMICRNFFAHRNAVCKTRDGLAHLIMKYLVYLKNKDNDSIVKQSFLMSKNLHFINNSGFYSNFINLIEHYHLPNFDPESLDNDRIRRYTTNVKEKYISFWRHSLEHSRKLEFYKVFKNEGHVKASKI